jgi:hypothetical protein
MTERPWLKFYPTNWRADPNLRMCSLAARGLWMEMLCIMHEASPRGHLVINGQPVTARQMANLSGVPVEECTELMAELELAGVFSRTKDGVPFSRRMVRETKASEEGRINGAAGGNPALKARQAPEDKRGDAEGVNPPRNPYMAYGNSNRTEPDASPDGQEASPREGTTSAPMARLEFGHTFWPAYPHKVGRRAAEEAFVKARRKATLAEIMDGLARYKSDKPPDRQWLNPETFLDQERWTDEPAPPAAKPVNGAGPSPAERAIASVERLRRQMGAASGGNNADADRSASSVELLPPGRVGAHVIAR